MNQIGLILPELILGVGALVMLLIGAAQGNKSADMLAILAVLLIAASAYFSMVAGDGRAFNGAFIMDSFARFTKAVILWSAVACVLLGAELFHPRKGPALRAADPDRAGDARHVADGVGRELHRALYEPRAAEPGALCAGRVQAGFHPLDRSRAQIFRPRLAVVRHDAVRYLADLRLLGHAGLRGRRCVDQGLRGVGRDDLRPRVPDRRPRVQDLRRAVPHVDAGRLRGFADTDHRLPRHCIPRLRPSRWCCAPSWCRSPPRSTSGNRSSS